MESNLSILTTQDLELRHNELVLLDRASLAIGEKDRIGLVGRNGSGKSTFLKIVTGELAADAGAVTRQRGLVVGYLPQDFSLDPKSNVGENIRTGARHVLDLIKEFESLPGNSLRHAELEERIGHFGGWNLDHRISLAGARLNCPDADRDIDSLSGGEMRRVALARAIVGQPDLLVLDEPTNHLDTDSIEWVVEFLAVYPGAILVVTHDRFFLDRVANSIIELRHGQFERYAGNYTDYLMARADKLATEEVLEHKRQMFLRRELSWARRQPKARTTKSKGRLDRLGEVLDQDAPAPEAEMDLVIPPAPPLGNRVADIVNVGMQLAGRQLFSNLTLSFTKGSRIGITGRNGLGKTTLLRILIGNLAPTEGEVRVGQLTEFNYVDQGRLQLREDRTVLEEVSDGTEWVRWGDSRLSLRGYLKRFLFTDDRIVTLVKHLSGGERSRLLLARILKQGGNFLILDEPTNDLDLPTLRVLEEALLAFSGCVVVVSHDRYFLNRVCTGILAFEGDGRLVYSLGNFEDYSERIRQRAPSLTSEPIPLKSDSALPRTQIKAGTNTPVLRRRKLTFKERHELEEIEAIIQAAETEVQRIEDIFVSPDFYSSHAARTNDLLAELEAAKDKVGRLYARWEELESLQRAES